jgi:CheY-like chemotaxis protein
MSDRAGETSTDTITTSQEAIVAPGLALHPENLPDLTRQYPILLSDDDPGIIMLMKLILERAGLTVLAALDPRDTLTICRASPVSLVISDVMKPVMSGFEMLNCLRTDPATRQLPFVFLSSGCNASRRKRGLSLGAHDYLCKPIYPNQLVTAIRTVLLEHGNWNPPPAYNPELHTALATTASVYADGPWFDRVWTIRRASHSESRA